MLILHSVNHTHRMPDSSRYVALIGARRPSGSLVNCRHRDKREVTF